MTDVGVIRTVFALPADKGMRIFLTWKRSFDQYTADLPEIPKDSLRRDVTDPGRSDRR